MQQRDHECLCVRAYLDALPCALLTGLVAGRVQCEEALEPYIPLQHKRHKQRALNIVTAGGMMVVVYTVNADLKERRLCGSW